MLALGTLLGTAFGMAAIPLFPAYHLDAGTFAIAGMGALLAASVRAPLTGIVLVLEMTDNYQLILPMIITCLGATLLAHSSAVSLCIRPFCNVLWRSRRPSRRQKRSRHRGRILERFTRVLDNGSKGPVIL